MQGGQGPQGEPGRGVYVLRRVVVALVILLVLALLVPQACQALLGSREEAGSGSSDTADTGSSGDAGSSEQAASEKAGGKEDAAGGASGSDETGAESSDRETSEDAESDENAESGEDYAEQNIEFDALEFDGTTTYLGGPSIGEPDQIAQVPLLNTGGQQGLVPEEPTFVPEPIVAPKQLADIQAPTIPAEPVALGAPVVPAEPVFFEEPVFEEPVFFAEPVFEEPVFFAEPVFEEPVFFAEQVAPGVEKQAAPSGGAAVAAVAVSVDMNNGHDGGQMRGGGSETSSVIVPHGDRNR